MTRALLTLALAAGPLTASAGSAQECVAAASSASTSASLLIGTSCPYVSPYMRVS